MKPSNCRSRLYPLIVNPGLAVASAVGSATAPVAGNTCPLSGAGPAIAVEAGVSGPTIAYSTFLGGVSGNPYGRVDKDEGNDIAVDGAGNIYVVGSTNSLGRYDSDVFVRKFDPTGSTLLYETFLDSNGTHDVGLGIAIDPAGNAYVTGQFGDPLLPGSALGVLVAKLSPTGVPRYKVTFGAGGRGYSMDYGVRIAADDAGNAYVVGTSYPYGTPFPTTAGAFQRTSAGGLSDAFVVKLNPSGGLVYSTLLGGSGADEGTSIALRKVGSVYHAYMTGVSSLANDFPTTSGALQRKFGGASDAFVAQLNDTGSALVYSTYLGGNGRDEAHGIAVDAAGNAYLTGWTGIEALDSASRFPIVNAFQPIYGGQGGATPAAANAFVSKLNPTGSALVFSSYMGGGGYELYDIGVAIEVDAAGYAYLTGITGTDTDIFTGSRFPIVNAFQPRRASAYYHDAFVAKVSPQGALIYSSYLGGLYTDEGHGIAVGPSGSVYVTGVTNSENFPITPDAYQPQISGGGCSYTFDCPDAFVVKIADGATLPDLVVSALAAPAASAAGAMITVTDTTKNQGSGSASASATKFYLSTDKTFGAGDVLLGSRAAPTLAAGAGSAAATAVRIPAGTVVGSYYLLARADASRVVSEANETNNARAGALSVGPDLVVSGLVAPASGRAGTRITVTNTVKNQGGSGARSSSTRFYLSINRTFGVGDVLLGSRAVTTLAAGASNAASSVVTVPSGTARGTYYVLAISDATKVVTEARETNNARSRAFTVE
jgi:hypothetical protein